MISIAQKTLEDVIAANRKADAIGASKVGDGLTVCGYSDRTAGTVVKVTKTKIVIREDKATLLNADELKFHVGGFAAHCSNVRDQKYAYEPDENGYEITVTRRTYKNRFGHECVVWKRAGHPTRQAGGSVLLGREKIYDYNF